MSLFLIFFFFFFFFFFSGVNCFFPVENSHFGTPKTNFRFKSEKKKKKKPSPLFLTFPTSISNFPPSLLQLSFFSSQFSPLFPCLFFPDTSANISWSEISGGHSAPLHPRLLRHWLYVSLCPPPRTPACYATGCMFHSKRTIHTYPKTHKGRKKKVLKNNYKK